MNRTFAMRRLLLIVLAASLAVGTAVAQDDVEAEKRKELERIQQEAAENRKAAERLKASEKKALGQLRGTERELGSTRKRIRRLEDQRKQLDGELSQAQLNLKRSTMSLEESRNRLARRLRSLYKRGARRDLEFLLSPASFAQLLTRWDFLVMVAEQDRTLIESIEREKARVEANAEKLSKTLTQVQTNESSASKEQRRLDRLRKQRRTEAEQIKNRRESYEAAAAELEESAAAIRSLLAQLERQRRSGRKPVPYHGDFAKGKGQLAWPVSGSLVGRFGQEKHPRWGTITMNNGVDIKTPIGTAVQAVAKGRVDYTSEEFGTYGQIIVINHGDGYYTLYGHLSEIMVLVNDEVASGQTIARSGETGSLKGPILHFEVRQGGTSLDPEGWLQ